MSFHFLTQHLWLIAAGGGAGVAGRYIQLRVRQAHRVMLPDASEELLRFGFNDFGKVWLVSGDPLASSLRLCAFAGDTFYFPHGDGVWYKREFVR